MPLYELSSELEVSQIKPSSFQSEKHLQRLFENNLNRLLGVRFIASEFTTGDRQRGRIDTLGLDQDGAPTIIEYKKTSKENVINQGLFYLDWLVDHKGDFTIAANEALGNNLEIDWSQPRLILIAESFSEYDKYAVNRIGANIELWTFHRYGDKFLYLEPIFTSSPLKKTKVEVEKKEPPPPIYTSEYHLKGKSEEIKSLFFALQERIFALAEEGEIIEKPNKLYFTYKHGKNFCEVRLQANALKLWLDISYQELNDPKGLGRDVSEIGHHGTGSVEVKFSDIEELDQVVDLIEQSFRQTI